MVNSTVSTTITKEIVLISTGGSYGNPLTVTASGQVAAPAPDSSYQQAAAIYANLTGASIYNLGVISGAIPAPGGYVAPAIRAAVALNLNNAGTITGQSGVYLDNGGTIINSGSIAGMDVQAVDGYGVRLANAMLANSGTVYGKRYGVAELNASEVVNHGTITGEDAGIKLAANMAGAAGTLINTGAIHGGDAGVTEYNAVISNSGIITGETYGIWSAFGGTIFNSGEISAANDGVLLLNGKYQQKFATTFTNSGTILGGYFGIALNDATVTNTASGLIAGHQFGAGVGNLGIFYNAGNVTAATGGVAVEGGGLLVNSGTIRGTDLGIDLLYQGDITNAATGTIASLETAVANQAGYLLNAGNVAGSVFGLEILSGGIAVSTGSISGHIAGVYLSTITATSSPDFLGNVGSIYGNAFGVILKNGIVYNYGNIRSGQIAVSLVAGTTFNNSGYSYGLLYGVQGSHGSVVNSGTIVGGANGIRISQGNVTTSGTISGTRYAIYGTDFTLTVDPGAVFDGNVIDRTRASLLNLGGATAGTLSGIGSQLIAFEAIDFNAGAHWLISGNSAGLATSQLISGFEQGDTIILNGFSATSESFVLGKGLELINGSTIEALNFAGNFSAANFVVSASGSNTSVSLQTNAPCFAGGTRILTTRGEIAVEALATGDRVITENGEEQRIIWLGRRAIDLRQHPAPARVQPVCIAANALAEDVPRRDLWVSPDHALFIDGHLVPAQLLVNGRNIWQGKLDRVEYYHVELAQHAVIFAENAPAESYLETGNRNAFENGGGVTTLHPDFGAMIRRDKSCAMLLLAGKELAEIRQVHLRRYAEVYGRSHSPH